MFDEQFMSLMREGLLREEDAPYWHLLTPERRQRMLDVLRQRTRHIVVGMEAVDDGHNQAAILRSADAFGVQEIAVVTGRGGFEPSERVTQGTHKWLTIHRYEDIRQAIESLRGRGYRIWASRLDKRAVPLPEVDVSRPAAFFFGNEHEGLSEEAVALADETFVIPMVGFAQSLNVSVAAAITLFHTTQRARHELGASYFLTREEQSQLLRHWLRIATPSVRRVAERLEGEQ